MHGFGLAKDQFQVLPYFHILGVNVAFNHLSHYFRLGWLFEKQIANSGLQLSAHDFKSVCETQVQIVLARFLSENLLVFIVVLNFIDEVTHSFLLCRYLSLEELNYHFDLRHLQTHHLPA